MIEALPQILPIEDYPADARLLPEALNRLNRLARGFHV